MKKYGKNHQNLMDLLNRVPGVKSHMESFEVQMGKKILQRRIELNLTQQQVVELVRSQGHSITQATISKVECGEGNVGSDTYEKIFEALGGISKLEVTFGELPKSTKRQLQLI